MNAIAAHYFMVKTKPNPAMAHGKISNGTVYTVGSLELDSMLRRNEDIIIVDLRDAEAYEAGHVPGAINLPRDQWHYSARLCEDALNILYSSTSDCPLAAQAAREFTNQGFLVAELEGGFEGWTAERFGVEE